MIKLLLVDDERIIREGILKMIDWMRLNIQVIGSCENGLSALQSMTDEMPDILMTDIKMPGVDGLELVERALTLHAGLQCIILSGYDSFSFAQKAIHMGVRDYLLKPCSKEAMEQALETVCGRLEEQRRQTNYQHSVRQEQMLILADKLRRLRPMNETDDIISAEQVRGLAVQVGDMVLLREAYVFLALQHEKEQKTPQLHRTTVQDVYHYQEEGELYALIANGLTALTPRVVARSGFVSEMLAYIHQHYDNAELSLQYLADQQIHMSADYIGKEFTRQVGMKLSAYLLQVRMEHAKRLLGSPDDVRMYEIAQRVGLGHNPNYFSRLFYKYEGISPKEYRMQGIHGKMTEI